MTIENLTPGQVLLWERYPFAEDEIIKKRYFIYLGKTNQYLACVMKAYLITGTTKTHYYEEGYEEDSAIRIRNTYKKYPAGTFGLPAETVFDFDMHLYDHELKTLKQCENDISVIHQLTKSELCEFYAYVCKAKNIALIVKEDIFRSLQEIGISNISSPARARKRKY